MSHSLRPSAVSSPGVFGTGAKVDVSVEGIGTLVTYYVVIYGDVNGDGAIDAFDTFTTDRAVNGIETLADSYFTAADIDADDAVALADYAVVKNAVAGTPIAANG